MYHYRLLCIFHHVSYYVFYALHVIMIIIRIGIDLCVYANIHVILGKAEIRKTSSPMALKESLISQVNKN